MGKAGIRWRLIRPAGLALILVGGIGMLAAFPFVYGDPAPGQDATDPSWFGPVATGLSIAIGLGIVLVGASFLRRLILRAGRG